MTWRGWLLTWVAAGWIAACGAGTGATPDGGGGGGADGGGGGGADGGGGGDPDGGGVSVIAEGTHATVTDPEGIELVVSALFDLVFGVAPDRLPAFEDDFYVVVSGGNGHLVHRLSDGAIVHDLRFDGAVSYLGVGAHNSLLSVGPEGYSDRRYNGSTEMFGFAQLGLIGQNVTDIAVIRAPIAGVEGVLLANNEIDQVERLDPVMDEFGGFTLGTPAVAQGDLAAVPGDVVSVWSPPGDGPFLGVSNSNTPGTPGALFWVDPADPSGLVVVGEVAEGPRRIRCLEPDGRICAVSSYVAGAITLVDWPDRAAPPTIGSTTVPVAGPVGIDLATVDGVPTVASTGFLDDTLHLTAIGAGLEPTDQSIALASCAAPGHVIILPGETHLLITCNGGGVFEARRMP